MGTRSCANREMYRGRDRGTEIVKQRQRQRQIERKRASEVWEEG